MVIEKTNNANGGFGFAFTHVLLLSVIARPLSAVIPSQSGRLSGQVLECAEFTQQRLIDHNVKFAAAAVHKRVFTVGNLPTGPGCSQQPALPNSAFIWFFFPSLGVNAP